MRTQLLKRRNREPCSALRFFLFANMPSIDPSLECAAAYFFALLFFTRKK